MIVDLQHVSLTYQSPDGEVEALRDVTFDVRDGEFISLVGPSGCGKSTLLSIICGLERPTSGQVCLDGEPVTGPTARIGYMPQKDQLFPWRSIWSNVLLGPELRGETALRRDRAQELLERYGLASFARKTPSQLSGGMRQRVALIRTLVPDPEILLLDEPFSALDYQTRLSVSADIYGIIRRERKTALLVTHDISESVSLSDRVVVLSGRPGRVKAIHDLAALRGLPPMARRERDDFRRCFNEIWKELDVNA
ncbi:MAG: ABC transporter ATP-binding protein [Ruminococcaceae bacterium]|nr:ABC transporter ATP-binding protein [Oscillospiraceae bacterium]